MKRRYTITVGERNTDPLETYVITSRDTVLKAPPAPAKRGKLNYLGKTKKPQPKPPVAKAERRQVVVGRFIGGAQGGTKGAVAFVSMEDIPLSDFKAANDN